MLIFIFILCHILMHLLNADASVSNNQNICFVVFAQRNKYHEIAYLKTEKDILQQAKDLDLLPRVFRSYDLHSNDIGHWTVFPILEKLSSFKDFKWIFFMEESTKINLENLMNVFKKYNFSEELFVGYALQDNDPTIIHHFADSASLLYPHFSAGFFISQPLLLRLISRLPLDEEYSFSIDPKYEFSKFIWDSGNDIKLHHEDQFCLTKNKENCATWIENDFPDCGLPLLVEKLQVGVKTCLKFHNDRITVIKNTWASETTNIKIFSDFEDNSIPTIKVNVENVAHGHCEKTLFILRHYIDSDIVFRWLAIVDDDTIISINRLRKLLPCYDSSDVVILGERYGYGVANSVGYDYITGGGGMIFSYPAVKLLVKHCQCPSIDSPDDMIIGLCLKRLGIPVTHSPHFHQARPADYSPEFLKPLKHISFHKHWMINPHNVFREWLQDTSYPELHTEL